MPDRSLTDQLVKYLADVHAIEEQALSQMRRAPAIAGDSEIGDVFAQHLHETERQEERIRGCLEAFGAEPTALKDVSGRAGGGGVGPVAQVQARPPGKPRAHPHSY